MFFTLEPKWEVTRGQDLVLPNFKPDIVSEGFGELERSKALSDHPHRFIALRHIGLLLNYIDVDNQVLSEILEITATATTSSITPAYDHVQIFAGLTAVTGIHEFSISVDAEQ